MPHMSNEETNKIMTGKDRKVPSIMKSDGSKFQNFHVDSSGVLKSIDPFCDGIIINYVYMEDDDGYPYLKPIISTICKNGEYSDSLTEEAIRLFRKVRNIYLELK